MVTSVVDSDGLSMGSGRRMLGAMFSVIRGVAGVRVRPVGGPAWLGLLAALAGLVVCLRLPWASDVLRGGWRWGGIRPPQDASGSVRAFAANGHLGGGWPADALNATVVVRDAWAVLLVAALIAVRVRRTLPGRWLTVFRLVAAVPLVVAPLVAAVVAAGAVRAVGVHALPGLVAVPGPLVAGALAGAVWLMPVGRAWLMPGAWRRALAVTVAFVVAAGGTVWSARWYTGSRLVSGTTSVRPAVADRPAPSRPGRVAWRLTPPRPGSAVWEHAGYTIITGYRDDPKGSRAGEVSVYDSATGRERWRYRRADAVLRVADLAGDTLDVQAVDMADRATLIGFDLASGHRRWSSRAAAGNFWVHPAPAELAGGVALFSEESAVPFEQPSFIGIRSPSHGGVSSLVSPDCTIGEAAARAATLVLNCHSLINMSLIHTYRLGLHLWTVEIPTNPRVRMQLGTGVLAVPSPSARPDWTFYRTSDGHRLWHEPGASRLFLTSDDRVLEQTTRGEIQVRDASTGRVLWSGDPRGLHLQPGGRLDGALAADGSLYATLRDPRGHVSLVTFAASSGAVTGTTDLTRLIGDPCRGGTCAAQRLDAAGGGVLLVTAAYGTPQDAVYALADGAGFTAR